MIIWKTLGSIYSVCVVLCAFKSKFFLFPHWIKYFFFIDSQTWIILFYFNSPDVILKLYNIDCCSFYGSSIWDLSSQCFSKLYTAWNTAIRILFNVPRDMHRYLIESISQCLHVKTLLASKCVSFYETIEASSKLCIRFLFNLCKNYLNIVLSRNLFLLQIIGL